MEADEADALQGSVAEFVAYGPAKQYFGKLLIEVTPPCGGAGRRRPLA